ncbi:RNA pyrophosphohydrolase [bacterium]|nr:RNA pyrophosphohydrolase [bacterium]
MIDREGFRANVGIILANDAGQLLLAKRIGQDAWQFPQGGIRRDETPLQAMYRELHEELGLRPEHVEILGQTSDWLRYRLPKKFIRKGRKPTCIGQKQQWFLLRMLADESALDFEADEVPEFDGWKWVTPDEPPETVIYFKRDVYRQALVEFAPLLR